MVKVTRANIRELIFCSSTVFLLLWIQAPLFAQQTDSSNFKYPNGQQKIESLKEGYLTRQLHLSPEQSQQFWPVYNQYQKEMRQLNRERKENQLNKNELSKASNNEIKQSLDKDFNYQEKALEIRKRYRDKFNQVLPPRKVMELYKSEKDFNMKLIRELRRRRNMDNMPPSRAGRRPPEWRPTGRR